MYTVPATFYSDRKKALAAAPGFLVVTAIAYDMLVNPRSGSFHESDRIIAGILLGVFGSLSLLIFVSLIRKKTLFSVSEKGIVLRDKSAISWSDIGEFKIVKLPNIDQRWIGVLFKDKDKYYEALNPAQKKRTDAIEKFTGIPVILDPRGIKGDPYEVANWLNECQKKYA